MINTSLVSQGSSCLSKSILSGHSKPLNRPNISLIETGNVPRTLSGVTVRSTKRPIYEGFTEDEIALSKLIRTHYDNQFTKLRISQEVAAQRMGLTQGTLNLYINGRKPIGYKPLTKFSKLLNIPLSELQSKPTEQGNPQEKSLIEIKSILNDLISAIDTNQNVELIMKKAKHAIK